MEFEREIIHERALARLESARARGRHGGRPQALDENKAKLARRLKEGGEHSVEEICSRLGVGAPPPTGTWATAALVKAVKGDR